MIKKVFKNLDYIILIIVFVFVAISVVALKSASQGAGEVEVKYTKQIMWFVIGLFFVFGLSFFDYKDLKKLIPPAYIFILLLLLLVLKTTPINGATSWFRIGSASLQPSEFFKIVLILSIASFIDFASEKEGINKIYNLLLSGLILAIPILLIIKQPDYGTAIVGIFIFAVMIFSAGLSYKYIVPALVLIIIAVPILYNFVLPTHAKNRIDVFLNPNLDPRGAGYNIIQSELAIGSGMLTGQGFFNGTQTQMGLLPMKTTDFIFPVISEEMGFVISSAIILLYGILLIRIINLSRNTKDTFGKLICIGIFAMIFAHVVENIGMCMGLLPITGIPLPFISYGGSSMLTNMIAIGLLMSVAVHKKKHAYLS